MTPVDYDDTDIPAAYDRARSRSPEVIARWMDTIAEQLGGGELPATTLDLGCGTGRFALPLAARFGTRVIGVDPSVKMLRQARTKPDADAIAFIAGRGEHIPLADGSVDLVFMSMVFHHLADPARGAAECFRVIRRGGLLFLRAGTAERIPSYPVTPFFPTAVPIMERVLTPAEDMVRVFGVVGFRAAARGAIDQEVAPTHAAYAEQLEAGGDSVLAQLDRSVLDAGVRALRSHALRVDPRPVREVIDFFCFRKGR